MKNKLLGTTANTAITAFVAAGIMVTSSGARGAETISVDVGGYFKAYLAAMRQDDGARESSANRRGSGAAREGGIKFSGQAQPDNRLTVGPPASAISLSGNAEKITYFTPRMSGFQLGISYTPENCEERAASGNCGGTFGGGQGDRTTPQQSEISEIIEFGANYIRQVGTVDLGLYAGYGKSGPDAATATDGAGAGAAAGAKDQEQWGLGVELSYRSFTFGADYRQDNRGTSAANADRTDYSMGVTCAMGNWTVAAGYAHGAVEAGAGLGEDETDGYQVGLNYGLAPGITLTGGVTFWDVEANTDAAASENTATEFIIGTSLSF
ncbi:MAG: porin [Alphaproteobacteria bacterium]|nr:porin [Alphaproteobacteria bacterium]